MSPRIVIPVAEDNGLDAPLSEHFGPAPYFAVVDLNEAGEVLEVKTIRNTSKHEEGTCQTPSYVAELKPDVVVVYDMGPKALQAFHDAGITVMKTEAETVNQLLVAYKAQKLEELIEGCPHAHHG
ncbi:MAG: NifB/NifX family molybdenum-iron cluster-binding protein [Candidatus Bathyarchaeota archaeon]|nr:NifB/NifX family molybdenum-iron cluster-binding protein [Candidatus Bathyarchaeota archaeon]